MLLTGPDLERVKALEAGVRDAIGAPFDLLKDGPDIATIVLTRLWTFKSEGGDGSNPKAFCAVMALATDAVRGARAALLMHDFGSVFTLLRRAEEMQTLAISFGYVPGAAAAWLAGGPVVQRDLRQAIEGMNPAVAEGLRLEYQLLSDETHGRAQHLAVYEDINGQFRWPPVAEGIDPQRVRAIFMTALVVLQAEFGILHWMIRDWAKLGESSAGIVAGYYETLVAFVLDRTSHGDWQAIAPGFAAEWLGIQVRP